VRGISALSTNHRCVKQKRGFGFPKGKEGSMCGLGLSPTPAGGRVEGQMNRIR
jgi:hypothetical protein